MNTGEKIGIGILGLFFLFVILDLVIIPIKYNSVEDHECIATVTDKERHEDGYYLIFCEDLNGNTVVLKNDDTMLRGKFDSSNMQQQIKEGKTYKFYVNGYRSEFWSLYENILSFEEYNISTKDKKGEAEEKQSEVITDNKEIDVEEIEIKLIPEITDQTEMPYFINIEFNSKESISIKKLYKPDVSNELDLADENTIRDTIIANGIDIFGTSFEVNENGVYWLYIQEISGTEYTQRFIIENIN